MSGNNMNIDASPSTTKEQDRHSASQRRVNQVWEFTQAAIAVTVTVAKVYVSIAPDIVDRIAMDVAFALIIGFYFGRSNHARIDDSKIPIDTR